MKKQAKTELRQLSREALNQKLAEARKELVELRLKVQTNQTKDVMAPGRKRQEVARLKTYLNLQENQENQA